MTNMITILGPTASGKTQLAAHLAADLRLSNIEAEIISGDSRQVYRKMDIGTGKDLCDYTVGEVTIPYHLIDICEPGEKYNIFRYQQDFHNVISLMKERKVFPILCGGSGLYIESVIKGYNLSPVPQNQILRTSLKNKTMDELIEILSDLKKQNNSCMHNKTDIDSQQRAIRAIEIETYNITNPTSRRYVAPIDTLIIGVDISRDMRREKISSRLKNRVDEGMIDEIQRILNSGVDAQDLIYYGLEYKYVTEYIIGNLTYTDMLRQLEIAIHQFAKRQMTWFRGMERRGCKIHWINALDSMEKKVERIKELMTKEQQ